MHVEMRNLAAEGVTHLAMEASSHGLTQRRLDGVNPAAAAFTNLGRDHMDYHETVADYLRDGAQEVGAATAEEYQFLTQLDFR